MSEWATTIRTYLNNIGIVGGFGLLMLVGYCVPSDQFLSQIGKVGFFETIRALVFSLACWTPTNLLLTTILACYISIALASRIRSEQIDIPAVWTDASLRGVLVWFGALGGASWLDFQKVFTATNESYVRLWVLVVGAGLALSIPPKEAVAKALRLGK